MRGEGFTITERGEHYTKGTCIAKYLQGMLADEENCEDSLEMLMLQCESPKIRLLWEIFFKIDVQDTELLEERIYQYGSMVKEHDYFGRELFVGIVSLLNQLKKKN